MFDITSQFGLRRARMESIFTSSTLFSSENLGNTYISMDMIETMLLEAHNCSDVWVFYFFFADGVHNKYPSLTMRLILSVANCIFYACNKQFEYLLYFKKIVEFFSFYSYF